MPAAPTPGLGFLSYIQIGKETTFNTAAVATSKLEIIDWNVQPVIGVIRDPSLYGGVSQRAIYQGSRYWKGTFKVRLNFEGQLELFRGALGTYASTVVETSVRDHKFTEGATLNSYTIEAALGNIPNGKCFRMTGATFTGVTLAGSATGGADENVIATFSVVAPDMQSAITPTAALNFPAVLNVPFNLGVTWNDGVTSDGTNRVRSWEYVIENMMDEKRLYVGSLTPDQALRNNFLKTTFKFVEEFATVQLFNAARNFTAGAPQLVMRGTTTIGSTSFREFEVHLNNANLVKQDTPVQGYGIMLASSEWEGSRDAATDLSTPFIRFRSLDAALP